LLLGTEEVAARFGEVLTRVDDEVESCRVVFSFAAGISRFLSRLGSSSSESESEPELEGSEDESDLLVDCLEASFVVFFTFFAGGSSSELLSELEGDLESESLDELSADRFVPFFLDEEADALLSEPEFESSLELESEPDLLSDESSLEELLEPLLESLLESLELDELELDELELDELDELDELELEELLELEPLELLELLFFLGLTSFFSFLSVFAGT
jgi:hypothetical protein